MALGEKGLNMAELCCVCMASSGSGTTDNTWQNIFTDTDIDLEQSLMSILEEASGSVVKPDYGLPQGICPTCQQTANIAFKFKRRFEESFCYLNEQIEQNENNEWEHQKTESLREDASYWEESASLTDDETEELNTLPSKPPFKCPRCPLVCKFKSDLRVHLRIHTGKRPFKCSHCEKSFKTAGALNGHLRIHTGKRPFQCSECPKAFSQKDTLTKHLRLHTGERPYNCSQCPKTFIHKTSLESHLLSHTGERNFECSYCSQTFIHKASLKAHLRTHTGERPFKCSQCSKSYTRRNILRKHLQSLHQMTL